MSDEGAPEGASTPSASDESNASNVGASESVANESQSTGAESAQSAKTPAEEFEEFKLGSAAYRVQKGAAEALKNMERAAQAKMQQAAQLQKQLIEFAKSNPKEFLKRTGVDPREFAEKYLAEELKRAGMTEEQRQLEELKAWKQQKEQEEQERLAREEQEKLTRAEQEEDQKIRTGMLEALQKSKLPEDPYFAARAAATMMAAQAQGLSWTWDQCVAKVERDFKESLRSIAGKMDPQGIQELLGEEPLKKWRQFDVSRVTSPLASKAAAPDNRPGATPASNKSAGQKKPMSEKEFFDFFGGM